MGYVSSVRSHGDAMSERGIVPLQTVVGGDSQYA